MCPEWVILGNSREGGSEVPFPQGKLLPCPLNEIRMEPALLSQPDRSRLSLQAGDRGQAAGQLSVCLHRRSSA